MSAQPVLDRAIVVVIPTLDEAGTIAGVLAQLADGLPRDHMVGLVVADGGSTDDTRAIVGGIAAGRDDLLLLENPDRLQSAAVNRVAAACGRDVRTLIRCDAHAGYPPRFVARTVEALERTGADSIVVPMDSSGRTCFGRAVAWVSDTPVGSGGSAHRGGTGSGFVDHGHHAGWRLAAFRAAGGYDAGMSHNEDAELDCRLRAAGARIWLEASIRLVYHVRGSPGRLWRQYFAYGRGRSRTVRRHPGSLRIRQLAVPSFIAANLLALIASPWLRWALLLPTAYLAILALTSAQVALRHRSRCGLLAGAAALIMHVGWAAGFAHGLLTARERRWRPTPLSGSGIDPGR